MSGSGFRGPGIEPRVTCPNGLAGTFRGARLSHPHFYHPRLPHGRLPAPENWSGRSNHNVPFSTWSNAKFQRPMFRGKSHFRPNDRGRGAIHRGALRFPNCNRSSIGSYSTDHNKNFKRPRTIFVQDQYDQDQLEQAKDESSLQQTPLLGSEEERQQKITETVVRLKEKLSNITKADITNFWQDDLSTISSPNVENKSTLYMGIPNLSFKDFKDISGIDSDNLKSDKSDGTNVVENVSNIIKDTVKQVENGPVIEVIDLVEIEQDIVHDVESLTVVNDITESTSQNDSGQKLQERTNSSRRVSFTSSTVSETHDTELVYSLQQNTAKKDLLKDQSVPSTENTQIQDHRLHTKCVTNSSNPQLGYQKSVDKFNLENVQKSCDDLQHEQVNTIIEMQYSLHRSISKITEEKTRWTPLPYETGSFRKKPFKSRWLQDCKHNKSRHNYINNKSKNESAGFDLHTSSPYIRRDLGSLCQESQYNSSFSLNECLPSGKFSTMPKLMHNQDNSQSMLCLDHNTSSFISTDVSPSQEYTLQAVPAIDSWKPSPSAMGYNTCKENGANTPKFNPQQPPPNFNNQKSTVALSPVFDSHFLSQEQSIHALDSSQLSAVSTSPTDLYCSVTFSTTQSTATLSTSSQLSKTLSPNFFSNVSTNFSPILTYATPLQMTPYEVTSSATISNTEHQTLLCDKLLDQVPNQHNIVEAKDELEEMQEAMQFAKQAMNITDIHNIIESDQTLCSEAHPLHMFLEQENVNDAQLHQTCNKKKEKLNQHCNTFNNKKKGHVIAESYVSSELDHEEQLNQNCNIDENALLINEETQRKMMFNLNPKLNKINEQGKWYQQNEGVEREKYVPCISQSNMHLNECSSEKIKGECPSPESSWKNRIINRFLRMSKNEIRNMINNCSLRKFDIAMKRLVKEKRSSLSFEMRNAEDEKMKSYDRVEFMNQLNAMLDPMATVDITNLPTDFIRHLSEVLQLDAIPLESNENVSSQSNNQSQLCANKQEMVHNSGIANNSNINETNDRTNLENNNQLEEYCNRITSVIAESSNNNNNKVTCVNSGKIEETRILDSNQTASKTGFIANDVHIDHITNDIHTLNKNITQKNIGKEVQHSLFNMTNLDDIFSTVAIREKGESKLISLDDKPKSTLQVNKTCETVKTLISTETASTVSKSERYNRWTRREREGPDAFRNLTKEEWEAKYGRHTKSSSTCCEAQTSRYYNKKHKDTGCSITFNSKRYSPDSFKRNRNCTTDISKRILKKDKNTEIVTSTSNSSESETDDTSTSSDNRTPSDVTKLLKVIKEKEKIAKNKSLNETIRDEVTAEIQRKWNEEGRKRKYHKRDKRNKGKRLRYKKQRKKKRRKVFDSSCSSNYDKEDRSSLLTETEIKKETISKEESDPVLDKSIRCDIKTVNIEFSKKEITPNVLTDKKVSAEIKKKSTLQDNDRSTQNSMIIQPKTKAQLKLLPDTSKCMQETEFMKNTARIVLNVKCKENKITALNNTDKPKVNEKIHQINKNITAINEALECPNNRSVDTIEIVPTVFNNNDSTNKNFISTSIIKKQHVQEKTDNLPQEVSLVTSEFQESSTKKCTDNKVTSKKIDIKAYKARALQRKLENEEKVKEKKSILDNNISKSIMEEKDTSNVALKEKRATVKINKISTDSNKFRNIRSEGKKELQLKNEKIKKKTEKETRVKKISSGNQEKVSDTSDASKLLESKADDDQLDDHIDKDECVQLPIQKIPIQTKEISVNDMVPLKNTLIEIGDESSERIVKDGNNTEFTIVITDKEKNMEVLKITNTTTQASEVLSGIKTTDLDQNGTVPLRKCDENKVEYRTRTISTFNESLAEHEMCNFINSHKLNLQKNRSETPTLDEHLYDSVEPSTDLELNLMQDVSQTNVDMPVYSTNVTDINVVPLSEQNMYLKEDTTIINDADQELLNNLGNTSVIPSNEQNINLKEDITIKNEVGRKLLENQDNINPVSLNEQNINSKENITTANEADQKLLENLEIQKVNSPESVGSPFKGFFSDPVKCSSCQHVETNTDKGNMERDKNKELQPDTNDKFDWHKLSNQVTLVNNNNISPRNMLNDALNTAEQTYIDKQKILYDKNREMNDSAAANLNNDAHLLNNGNDKDKKKEKIGQIFLHDCTKNFQNHEKNTDKIEQSKYFIENEESMELTNNDTNSPHTSSGQHKILVLNEYEDNIVMEKSDPSILKDSCFKENQSCIKNIDSICASTDINLLDINSTMACSFSDISNETSKNVVNTDTESSLSLLVESSTIQNNSAFKNIPNQNIITSPNIDSCEKESTNNDDLYLNNSSCANFSVNLPICAERLWTSPTKETSNILKIPTKAALKESRNFFAITDGSFISAKETMELRDAHFKLNVCNDQKAINFLSDKISQKENIDNKIINLEQMNSHKMHTYIPDDKNSHKSVDIDSISKTVLNNVKIIHDEISTPSNHSSYIQELECNNILHSPVVELEKIKETNKNDEDLEKLSCTNTYKQEQTNNLHRRIKAKEAMEHKIKNKYKSNTVHITNTNIKEEIMARMIEIDVEIHKLMTEKMTLYQMLESDSLLSNKLPLHNNLGSEINKERIVSVRPQTSSSAISRIMQIAGTSFAEHSDCKVTSNRENALSEISQNQVEPKVGDTNGNKKTSLLQEENLSCKEIVLSHSLKDGIISEDSGSSQSSLIFKDEDKEEEDGMVLLGDQLKENQDTCNSIGETLNNLTESSSSESIPYFEKEAQLCVSSPTDVELSNENQNAKNTSDGEKRQNMQLVKASKDTNSTCASLIYSDDSTWSSFAPSFEDLEQKKHNTGLALLEETYKREMAENRKLKASARKKKKKELDKFLKSVNYLTPEEEEIPLNTLYIKKLQQKRDLLDLLDDKKENSVIDNCANSVESEEIWKHAIEVINAVAEDRINDLYAEKAKEIESKILITPSNTIKQYADNGKSNMLTNDVELLSETKVTVSSLNCDQEPISIKCSLSVIENDVHQSKETDEVNENKKTHVQSTINSYNNLEANPAVVNISSDDKITEKEISLGEQLFNPDNITNTSVHIEANELNISNTKLNKNQNDHILEANSSNEDITVSISASSNLKYNNEIEETNKQSICLLKNTGIGTSKIVYGVDGTISSTVEGTSNVKNSSVKKCKDRVPTITNSFEIIECNDISRSINVHDKKPFKRKNVNKNILMRKNSKCTEDTIKHMQSDDTNTNGEKNSPKVLWHDSKGISWADQELESASSNVKRNRNSQKLQNIKDKKYINCLKEEASLNDQSSVVNEHFIGHSLPNVDSKVSTSKIRGIAVKRKINNQSEMMNCKVILVDVLKSSKCQHTVKKCHTSSSKTHVSYKSTTAKTTTNFTHPVTSSLITDACKVTNIPKSKHSFTSDNIQEQTSTANPKHMTKIYNTLDNIKEAKSQHKVNALHDDEHLSLESNKKDISVVSVKTITPNMKILPQEDRNSEIDTLEKRTKDQHHDEQIASPDTITGSEQPLRTQYTVHKGPILDIKVFGDTFLAASEDGSIYRYKQIFNGILNIYKGHRSAVTCLYIHKSSSTDYPKDLVYSGSLDGTLRCYNIKTGASVNSVANVGSPVQCMDQAWGIIFIGTKSGHVSRFHIKCGVIKGDNIQFSNQSVLALKATNEGPRKVLIVATRNQPITIRDAQNGLFLRTICGQRNHTVYSLMLNNSLIYCGTSSTSILVFDFTNGEQMARYDAGVGIVCMRLYHKLLFAGCYDGNIYVFDIQDHKLICSIPGPGNMLLSMEVVDNKIIAGSKDKRLHTWQMPKQVQVVSHEIT